MQKTETKKHLKKTITEIRLKIGAFDQGLEKSSKPDFTDPVLNSEELRVFDTSQQICNIIIRTLSMHTVSVNKVHEIF